MAPNPEIDTRTPTTHNNRYSFIRRGQITPESPSSQATPHLPKSPRMQPANSTALPLRHLRQLNEKGGFNRELSP